MQVATIVMKDGGYWKSFAPDVRRCSISERIGNTVAVIGTERHELVALVAVSDVPKRFLVVTLRGGTTSEEK